MKKLLIVVAALVVIGVGIQIINQPMKEKPNSSASPYSYTLGNTSSYDNRTSYSSSSYGSFTNKYGTRTTKCAHIGCNNYIASSGDTNCCTIHSNRCLECHKYIDEDAYWCSSCLRNAVSQLN